MHPDMRVVVGRWAYVPHHCLTPADAQSLRDDCTFTYPYTDDNGRPRKRRVHMYYEGKPGWIGLPIDYALTKYPAAPVVDATVPGQPIAPPPKRPDPTHPRAGDGQAGFIEGLHKALDNSYTAVGVSGTGTGKTVSGLELFARRDCTGVVICHKDQIALQWLEAAKEHLGLPDHRIGWVQQDRQDFEGKDFIICSGPSLAKRRYDDAFYNYPGFVIWDELHRMAAPMLSKTMPLFPAAYRLGLTATFERRDGCHHMLSSYLGAPAIINRGRMVPLTVYVSNYHLDVTRYKGMSRRTTAGAVLAKDYHRNRYVAAQVLALRTEGHRVLFVGDSIDQIEDLIGMLEGEGVPADSIGQFTGEHTGSNGNRQTTCQEYLDFCKKHCNIIGATYGMITEGIDIEGLTAGVDASPRGAATQLVGRIRRPSVGRLPAVWVTIKDVGCKPLKDAFYLRLQDYRADKDTTIIELGDISYANRAR